LGDRLAAMLGAVGAMHSIGRIRSVSYLYASAPVGPPQPDFLNAAVRLETDLAPSQLLDGLLAIERDAGRVRRVRWGPRTLDLDILWVAGVHLDQPELRIPHPELTKRAFAILPLLDVAPSAADPRTGIAYRDLVPVLLTAGVQRVSKPEWPSGLHH
jgi:2-amino-4-hydroxy-6-hydroxymethyldihydropteridine diphosphokinase